MVIDWTKEYDGAAEPNSGGNYNWTLVGTDHASSDGNILTINTVGKGGVACYYTQAPDVNFDNGFTLEFRAKVIAIEGDWMGVEIRDGTQSEAALFYFFADRVQLNSYGATEYLMNTTDKFHIYRITVSGTTIKLYVDGIRRITDTVSASASDLVIFGDARTATGKNQNVQIDYLNYKLGAAITPPHPSLGFFIIA